MRIRSSLLAFALAGILSVDVAVAHNPIPGVGIVVKRNPGTQYPAGIPGG
jgi:hypothetical protein